MTITHSPPNVHAPRTARNRNVRCGALRLRTAHVPRVAILFLTDCQADYSRCWPRRYVPQTHSYTDRAHRHRYKDTPPQSEDSQSRRRRAQCGLKLVSRGKHSKPEKCRNDMIRKVGRRGQDTSQNPRGLYLGKPVPYLSYPGPIGWRHRPAHPARSSPHAHPSLSVASPPGCPPRMRRSG